MKHMILLIVFIVIKHVHLFSQSGPAEIMGGSSYLHYQHGLSKPVGQTSRIGWQHITTLIRRHERVREKTGLPNEVMSQVYVTYRMYSWLAAKGGLFYTNTGGYQPSIGLDIVYRKRDLLILSSPRADIGDVKSFELFGAIEYAPSKPGALSLYSRFQFMSNVSSEGHNRSYQLFRVGVDYKGTQFGAGLNLDEYGRSAAVYRNMGLFVRRML